MNQCIYHYKSNRIIGFQEVRVKAYQLSATDFPYDTEIIAENLNVPWAIAISEDGTIYVTERIGNLRVIREGKLQEKPLMTFGPPFISRGEGGLMGIALDPDFAQNHYLYVMHTYQEGSQLYNRVIRLLEQNNEVTIDGVLIDKIPGSQSHNGGRIKIGPDEKLYITTGDVDNPATSQDLSNLAGKILRIELDGSIPEDNPIPGSPIYSYGLRNSQGLAWNKNQVLYASDHGSIAHDEINLITPGGNYGWPMDQSGGGTSQADVIAPVINSGSNTWAPSGIAFVDQGAWQGKLLAAALRGEQLLSFTFNDEGTVIEEVEGWLSKEYGRLREVVQAKDGSIYIATNNRDGRSRPNKNDDKIIRLVPKQV